jgi:competence protein ComEC
VIARTITQFENYPTFQRLKEYFSLTESYIENKLTDESDQLPLWIPAGLAMGIIIWEVFGSDALRYILAASVILFLAASIRRDKMRWAFVVKSAAAYALIGFLAIMAKSALVAAPPLQQIQISQFYGRIIKVEQLTARQKVRFELETGGHGALPPKIRVNLTLEQFRPEFTVGSIISLRARLVPPAGPSLPGAYDFARRAWFAEIGATGTALGTITLYKKSKTESALANTRDWIASKVETALPKQSGAIALALATGEQGKISEDDADAMRNSGLAHLLSISGLHVTAVVGAIFFLMSRILALFPYFALRQPVPVYAACAAAIGAIGYTLLTGAQVPTLRSCIAALMILAALALGRDALSLRLVAFGATVILLFWPEALAGPSFQLSFAAVATIIVLHDSKWMRAVALRGAGRGIFYRLLVGLFGLLVTGIAIELILAPIALFHFHKTGLYGAMANIIAIPLTTFVIMPFEALGLLFDLVGFGAPFWWVAGQGISAIIWIAHYVSGLPGAVAMFPAMPDWAFGMIVFGSFWCGILKSAMRWFGLSLCVFGAVGILVAPYPDVLVTGDGKHLAITDADGNFTILRSKAGEYIRDTLKENAGINAEPIAIEDWPGADCSLDACVVNLRREERNWTLLAIRTRYSIPAMELAAACKRADIVVSERWLPYSCKPRWIKADRNMLEQTGGLAFYLASGKVDSVSQKSRNSPWVHVVDRAATDRTMMPRYKGTDLKKSPLAKNEASLNLPN